MQHEQSGLKLNMGNAQTIKRTLKLIGAASCTGAKDTRCDMGPETIRASHLLSELGDAGIEGNWDQIMRPRNNDSDLEAIVDLCTQIENRIQTTVTKKQKFSLVGGDHSCAIGTWSGVANVLGHQSTGLIWIDAHMDSHTPDTSPSGAIHGMPLASLLGQGEPSLCDIGKPGQKLNPEMVCLIGVRSFESAEHQLLDKLGVKIFFINEIRKRGLSAVMDDALEIVKKSSGFGVSIDLDSIDPVDAPGVGSPSQEGLQAEILLNELKRISREKNFIGSEIAEFNPFRDVNKKTAQLVNDLIIAMA